MNDIYLLTKKQFLILKNCDGSYASMIAKECDTTYAYTVKVLFIMRDKGILSIKKSGRNNIITLGDSGKNILKYYEIIVELMNKR